MSIDHLQFIGNNVDTEALCFSRTYAFLHGFACLNQIGTKSSSATGLRARKLASLESQTDFAIVPVCIHKRFSSDPKGPRTVHACTLLSELMSVCSSFQLDLN